MLMRVAALALVPRVIRALSRKPQAEARLPAPAEVEQPLEKPEPVVTSPAKVQKTPARRWTITRSVKRESAILCGWWAPTGTRGPPSHFGGSRSWAYLHRRSFPINRSDPSGRSFLAANGTFTLDIVAVFNSQREIVKYTLLVTGKTTDARFPSVKANLSVQTTANHTTKDVPITLNDRTGVYPGQSSVIMDALSADIGSLKMFDILVTDLKKAADEGACGVDFALALSRTLDSMFNFTFLDPPVAFRLGLSDGGLLLDENLRPITFLRNGVNVRASRPSDN